MRPAIIGLALGLSLCAMLGGCTFARNKINTEDFHAKAQAIVPGKTTASEVVEILGSPPNAILQLGDQRAYSYTFGDAKTGGLNLFVFSTQRTNTGIDSAFFFLDQNNVVKSTIISSHSRDLSWDWWAFGE